MTKELTGLIYKLLNIFCFVIIGLINKGVLKDLSTFQTFFLSCLSSLIVTGTIAKFYMKASLISYIKSVDRTFLYIALLTFISLASFLHSLKLIDIATVSAISYLTPVVVSLLGIFVLRERFSIKALLALVISIVGTVIIILPALNSKPHFIGVIVAMTSALGWAIYDLLLKKQAHMHWVKQSFILLSLCVPMSLPLALATWKPLTPTHVKFFILLGMLYSLNKMFLMKALANTRLILLATVGYTKLIFAAVFGYLIFNEVISFNTVLGGALILSATMLLMYSTKDPKSTDLVE
jgi:drug/metabolite transporter (DMT)-like permease